MREKKEAGQIPPVAWISYRIIDTTNPEQGSRLKAPDWKPFAARLLAAAGGTFVLYAGIAAVALGSLARLFGPHFPHALAQMFGAAIAVGIFMLAWNGRRYLDNHYFLFFGISLLFVGIIDFIQVLVFDGWIGARGTHLDTRLWYAARYFLFGSLVIAPRFVDRKVPVAGTLSAMFAAGAALAGLFARGMPLGWFDHLAHPRFMGALDLGLYFLGAAGYAGLRRVRGRFDEEVYLRLALSILLAIGSVGAEGLGMRRFAAFSLVADALLVFSFYLFYKAVIETGLMRPYALLFRNLKRSEEEAHAARNALEARVSERTRELRGVNERLERELAARKAMVQEQEMTIGLLREIDRSGTVKELVAGVTGFLRERSGCETVRVLYRAGAEYAHLGDLDLNEWNVHSEITFCRVDGEGKRAGESTPVPSPQCVCGAIMPGVFDPSRPMFLGDAAFWTNSSPALADRAGGFRRRVGRGLSCSEGFESMALVPMRIGDETLGILHLCDRRKDLFTRELIAGFERMADHLAVALARHLAREALRESEGRFRSLVESVPAGIQIVQEGRVAFGNPRARGFFGEVPDAVRLRDIGEVVPEDLEKFERLCEAVERDEAGGEAMELRFILPMGDAGRKTVRWLLCQTERVEYRGKPATLIVLNDLTQMRDLEQLASNREKLSIIGQMAAGIAHEIRNPLSGININVATLEHVIRGLEEVPPPDKEMIGELVSQTRAASDKIAVVIRRVMDFSKPVHPTPVPVDANQVARAVLEFSSATLRKGGIAVEGRLAAGLPRCNADPRLLEQVLLNLVTNAIEAMAGVGHGKRLGVATAVDGGSVVIRVFDNGPGIPPHFRERVFEPFYTTRQAGHGIGLSFSRRVVENLGGTLTASESEWSGAEFRVVLQAETGRSPA